LGGCEIFIANAGVSTMQHALELTDDEWDVNFNVNARGVFLTDQIVARHFVWHGKSCIVNTASLAAKISPAARPLLSIEVRCSGWTQALARELAPKRHTGQRHVSRIRQDEHADG
jgi:meso-butanediol dehydrogenase/(S,S)-butanediol dehydrogenase/diacetyl reductase